MLCCTEDGSEGVRLDWFVKMFQVHEEESAVHYQGNIGRKSGRASSTASLPTSRESAASVSELYLQSPMHDSCLQPDNLGPGRLDAPCSSAASQVHAARVARKQKPQPAHGGTFKPRSCRARYSLRSGAVCCSSPWNGFVYEICPAPLYSSSRIGRCEVQHYISGDRMRTGCSTSAYPETDSPIRYCPTPL